MTCTNITASDLNNKLKIEVKIKNALLKFSSLFGVSQVDHTLFSFFGTYTTKDGVQGKRYLISFMQLEPQNLTLKVDNSSVCFTKYRLVEEENEESKGRKGRAVLS